MPSKREREGAEAGRGLMRPETPSSPVDLRGFSDFRDEQGEWNWAVAALLPYVYLDIPANIFQSFHCIRVLEWPRESEGFVWKETVACID